VGLGLYILVPKCYRAGFVSVYLTVWRLGNWGGAWAKGTDQVSRDSPVKPWNPGYLDQGVLWAGCGLHPRYVGFPVLDLGWRKLFFTMVGLEAF
jgi:hypothetical protein